MFDYVGAMHTLPDDLVVLVCFAPEHDRVDGTDQAAVERAVRQFAPNAEVIATATHEWVNDEWSKGTWTTFRGGQISAYEPYLAAHEGRVLRRSAHGAPLAGVHRRRDRQWAPCCQGCTCAPLTGRPPVHARPGLG